MTAVAAAGDGKPVKCVSQRAVTDDLLQLRCRVRVLFCLLLGVILVTSAAFWMCFSELRKLRGDFEGKIVQRGTAEFADLDGLYNAVRSRMELKDAELVLDPIATDDEEQEIDDGDIKENIPAEEEDLIRVRRRAGNSSPRQRDVAFRASSHRGRRPRKVKHHRPTFYSPNMDGGGGGSGANPADWVWLTSYSRIPVSVLQRER